MKRIFQFILPVFLFAVTDLFAQQAGQLDTLFNPTDIGFSAGDGASAIVRTSVVQPDGKILIGGEFYRYNGITRSYLARLNADGSIDSSFNPGTGANYFIYSIVLQPDGKIIIGGGFNIYNGTPHKFITRLNTDGSLDTSFNSGTGANGAVRSTSLQPDGKIIIGGEFTSYNGISRNRIARLNIDGSLDTSFNPGTGFNLIPSHSCIVKTTTLQPDGKIIVSGNFSSFNGTSRNYIARLHTNGSLDLSFSVFGLDNWPEAIVVQPDDKIVIGGSFNLVNGTACKKLARLNTNGSVDTNFNGSTGLNNWGGVGSIALQPDGKIIIGGVFESFNGVPRLNIARLHTDGTLDTGFSTGTGIDRSVSTITLQPDGKIIIGGNFTSYNGFSSSCIARLNTNSSYDPGFNPGMGANEAVYKTVLQPDGKILIAGKFSGFNGVVRNKIARLNPDGSLNVDFTPGQFIGQFNGDLIDNVALQADGKIIISGDYKIARLDSNGSFDTGFNSGTGFGLGSGAGGPVFALALQADGKIVAGGGFGSYNRTWRSRIVRINANGTNDLSFDPGSGADHFVRTIAIQPDGKIIIGGEFTTYNGIPRNKIARLNTDGSLDTSFNPGTGASGEVLTVAIQPDGKIVISGSFYSYNGIPRNRVARLNTDGSLDASFDAGSGPQGLNSRPFTTTLLANGKILIGGEFDTFNGSPAFNIVRLNSDGSLDTGFNPGAGPQNGHIVTAIEQADGNIIIGGSFTSYNGIGRNRVARLYGNGGTGLGPDVAAENRPSVYPNPVNSNQLVTVKVADALTDPGMVTMYDALGKQVIQQAIATGQRDISLSLKGIPAGLYQLKVISGKYRSYTKIVIL